MTDNLNRFVHDLVIPGCNAQVSTLQKVLCVLSDEAELMKVLKGHEMEDVYVLGGVKPEKDSRAGDDDISHKNYFFLDFDIRNDYIKRTGNDITDESIRAIGATIAERLGGHEFLKDWRYMVFTGNGIHVYYFGQPVVVENKRWWSIGVARMIDEAARAVGINPDVGCKNVARISRMPGSFNNKHGRHVPVEILRFEDRSFNVDSIQKIGAAEEKSAMSQQQNQTPVEPKTDGVESTMDAINAIPIGPLACSIMGWALAQDGKHFTDPGGQKEKASYISKNGNFILHGGTDHLPASAEGFSPFEFVRAVKGLDAKGTFDWFRKNYPQIAAVSKREYEFKKANAFPFVDLSSMVDRASAYLKALDPDSIFSFGYPPLDDHLGGIYPSEVIMVGGESGTGKTSFLTSVLKHNAARNKVIFFSLEDTLTDYTLKQIWFSIGKIRKQRGLKNYPWKEFRNNCITSPEYASDREAAEAMVKEQGNLVFYDVTDINAPDKMDVETLADLIEKAVKRGYKLFGIDHLHFFNMDVKNSSKADKIEEVMQRIKALANKHDIAIILLAHYKKLMGEKPTLDSFKDSSAIVQTANVVINMWRDRSDDLGSDINETHFMMPKVRSPVGEKTIVMKFNPTTFEYEYVDDRKGTHQEMSREKEISMLKAKAPPKSIAGLNKAEDDIFNPFGV